MPGSRSEKKEELKRRLDEALRECARLREENARLRVACGIAADPADDGRVQMLLEPPRLTPNWVG